MRNQKNVLQGQVAVELPSPPSRRASLGSIVRMSNEMEKIPSPPSPNNPSRTARLWSWARTTFRIVHAFQSAGRSRRRRADRDPSDAADEEEEEEGEGEGEIGTRSGAGRASGGGDGVGNARAASASVGVGRRSSSFGSHSIGEMRAMSGSEEKDKDSDAEADPHVALGEEEEEEGGHAFPSENMSPRRQRHRGSRLWSWARTSLRTINAFQSAGRLRRRRENDRRDSEGSDDVVVSTREDTRGAEGEPLLVSSRSSSRRASLLAHSHGPAPSSTATGSNNSQTGNTHSSLGSGGGASGVSGGGVGVAASSRGARKLFRRSVERLVYQMRVIRAFRDSLIRRVMYTPDVQPSPSENHQRASALWRDAFVRVRYQLRVVKAFRNALIRRLLDSERQPSVFSPLSESGWDPRWRWRHAIRMVILLLRASRAFHHAANLISFNE